MKRIKLRAFLALERRLRIGLACSLPRVEPPPEPEPPPAPGRRKRAMDLPELLIEAAARVAQAGRVVYVADLAREIGVRNSIACRAVQRLRGEDRWKHPTRRGRRMSP